MTKPFSRDRALHGGYKQNSSARRQRRALRKELQQLSLPEPEVERVDVLKLAMDLGALSAMARKREDMAAWEAAEAADTARGIVAGAFTGYRVQRATTRPTDAETAAFLAWEREHLGVDRVAGTIVDPRLLSGRKP